MKKYTFTFNNSNTSKNIFTCPFSSTCKSTDYSKVLDDLIAADIKEKNPWLYSSSYTSTCPLATGKKIKININPTINDDLETAFIYGDKFDKKYNIDLIDAYNFLTNLGTNCPFKKNTTYKLSSGDYIEVTDDYIHINDKMYFFNLMDNYFFTNLNNNLKKTIATIYIDGLKITIKK